MLLTRTFAIIALSALFGACGSYFLLRPEQHLNQTQDVVLKEYVDAFCRHDDRHDRNFIVGQAATVTRIAVKSKIGNLALIEYAKCRAGLS